uniref:Protein FAR1-RELATED SEQUENCE n=1 Tax=Cajanus cajan TaxID=3821 RepID=A0A151RF16_CAJCA|nr:Protein FAR1-RELATED SEQUENCE 6 [Cajanus cajan]
MVNPVIVEESEEFERCSTSIREEIPKVGMILNSEEELYAFYKKYAYEVGFGIRKISTKTKGEVTYYSLACSKGGKYVCKTSLSSKIGCQEIFFVIIASGKCTISSINLEHSHALSPKKSRFQMSHKKMDSYSKRRLELNDKGETIKAGVGDAKALCNYFIRMQKKNSNFFYVIDMDDEGHLRNVFWVDAISREAYDSFGDVVSFDSTYLTNRYNMPFSPFVGVNHHGQSILFGCGLLSREDIDTYVWLFKSWLECMRGRTPKAIITYQCRSIQAAVAEVFPQSHHRFCLWHIMKKVPEKLGGLAQYKEKKKTLKAILYDFVELNDFIVGWQRMIDDFGLQENEWLSSLFFDRGRWVPVYVKSIFWAGMSTTQRSESMNAFFDGYVNSKTSLAQFVEQYDSALKKNVKEIPSRYILTRWRKDVKHSHYYVLICYDEISDQGVEFDKLCANFYEAGHLANSRRKYDFLMEWIDKSKEKLKDDMGWDRSKQITLPSIDHVIKSNEKLLSPLQVRSKGRPPSKRKESKMEKIIKKKKKKEVNIKYVFL